VNLVIRGGDDMTHVASVTFLRKKFDISYQST